MRLEERKDRSRSLFKGGSFRFKRRTNGGSIPVSIGDEPEEHRATCLSRRKDLQRRTCVAEETKEATRVHAVHEEGTSGYTPQAKPSFFFGERSAARNGGVGIPLARLVQPAHRRIPRTSGRRDLPFVSLHRRFRIHVALVGSLRAQGDVLFRSIPRGRSGSEGPREFLLSRDGRSSVDPHVTCPCRHKATHGERSRRRKRARRRE